MFSGVLTSSGRPVLKVDRSHDPLHEKIARNQKNLVKVLDGDSSGGVNHGAFIVQKTTEDDDSSDSDVEVDEGEITEYVSKGGIVVNYGSSSDLAIHNLINDTSHVQYKLEDQFKAVENIDPAYLLYTDRLQAELGESINDLVPSQNTVFLTKNDKAWFNNRVFISWVERCILPLCTNLSKRILLLIDCCSLHRTTDVHLFCQRHNIDVLFIPANCTALLQPLDIGINRIVKDFMRGFTIGRIFYEYSLDGSKQNDSKYLTEDVFNCAMLECINRIKRSSILNSFERMIYGARYDAAKGKKKD